MIVFTGDWVKVYDQWKQVVAIDGDDYATLDVDGYPQWWSTGDVVGGHVSNTQMQAKLKECGL